jgi:hypothetical protein
VSVNKGFDFHNDQAPPPLPAFRIALPNQRFDALQKNKVASVGPYRKTHNPRPYG